MTIIVYDASADVVFADRKHTYDHYVGLEPNADSKVHVIGGASIACAGNSIPIHMLTPAFGDLLNKVTPCDRTVRQQFAGFADDVCVEGLGRSPDGRVFVLFFEKGYIDGFAINRESPHVPAIGCGASWFNAYVALGHGVEEAFHMVCKHHSGCGLGYDKF